MDRRRGPLSSAAVAAFDAPYTAVKFAAPPEWSRALMVAVGVGLLMLSGVRMRGSLEISAASGAVQAGTVEVDSQQGFLPMLSRPGAIDPADDGVLRSQLGASKRAGLGLSVAQEDSAVDTGMAGIDTRPVRLVIPEIGLDAPIVGAALLPAEVEGANVYQWQAPDAFAVGWHRGSALLGDRGNVVLNGHHNAFGEVFRRLDELQEGDRIFVFANQGGLSFRYEVTEVLILEERSQPLDLRLRNARYIQSTSDERLTLITCWPYQTNTHRLIIVARPLYQDVGAGYLQAE